MRIEAPNLQEAFQKAAAELNCSVTELDIKVIQHPSGGFLGFFKKSAIIEVTRENDAKPTDEKHKHKNKNGHEKAKNGVAHEAHNKTKTEKNEQNFSSSNDKSDRHSKFEKDEKKRNKHRKNRDHHEKQEENKQSIGDITSTAFVDKESDEEAQAPKQEYVVKRIDNEPKKDILNKAILDNFNQIDQDDEQKPQPQTQKTSKKDNKKEALNVDEFLPQIRDGIERLFKASSFAVDKISVSKFDDECVFIEIDGEDAALLIGKEGYRYKAISYLLYSWINLKFGLSIRLEIAQFLKNQEDAIEQYLEGVIERVQSSGKGQTKPLDGVLVKIALEKLRKRFPDKYVSIKSNNEGKFVIVNEFFKK